MIRYRDTHKFYDKFYDEIEEIRFELQEQGILENNFIDSDLKNYFAWLSFEHVAYKKSMLTTGLKLLKIRGFFLF